MTRRRVVDARRASIPSIGKSKAVDGRIMVIPSGSVGWLAGSGPGTGAWLWPTGRGPRRLAGPTRGRASAVRVIDDRHIDAGDERILRYGAATPGSCPTPAGLATTTLGPYELVDLPQVDVGDSPDAFAPETTSYYLALLCDPRVGDYVETWRTAFASGRYDQSGALPAGDYETAGVVLRANVGYSPFVQVHAPAVSASVASGALRGTGVPIQQGDAATPVGARVVPGAATWVADASSETSRISSRAEKTPVRRVWLADAAGTRIVGTIPPGDPVTASDPRLTLDTTSVGWTDGSGPHTTPVRPVPGDTLKTASKP